MSDYYPEPKSLGRRLKFDFSNYATKVDLKNATGVDISKFAENFDLASLKSTADNLDVD